MAVVTCRDGLVEGQNGRPSSTPTCPSIVITDLRTALAACLCTLRHATTTPTTSGTDSQPAAANSPANSNATTPDSPDGSTPTATPSPSDDTTPPHPSGPVPAASNATQHPVRRGLLSLSIAIPALRMDRRGGLDPDLLWAPVRAPYPATWSDAAGRERSIRSGHQHGELAHDRGTESCSAASHDSGISLRQPLPSTRAAEWNTFDPRLGVRGCGGGGCLDQLWWGPCELDTGHRYMEVRGHHRAW